jgi:hypothetical protein
MNDRTMYLHAIQKWTLLANNPKWGWYELEMEMPVLKTYKFSCSFCERFHERSSCHDCPLLEHDICNPGDDDVDDLYSRFMDAQDEEQFLKAGHYAEDMVAALTELALEAGYTFHEEEIATIDD